MITVNPSRSVKEYLAGVSSELLLKGGGRVRSLKNDSNAGPGGPSVTENRRSGRVGEGTWVSRPKVQFRFCYLRTVWP